MEDSAIVDLYWQRSESAIQETDTKYGSYCYTIAHNILNNRQDAEESVSDTYLAAWNSLPPHRPSVLTAFLGKLTRRISIDRWRHLTARKRGSGELELSLEELENCVSGEPGAEEVLLRREVTAALNRFLGQLPETERTVFLSRYWYLDPVAVIAQQFGFSETKTAAMLRRTRLKLREQLRKEGY